MNLDDFLSTLTSEQKEKLKSALDDSPLPEPIEKPKRRQRRTSSKTSRSSGKIKKVGKVTAKSGKSKKNRRVEPVSTEQQENIFKTNRRALITDTEFKKGRDKDNRDDKLLSGENELTDRGEQRLGYLEAKCSKCEFMYENVPSNRCYTDDSESVFICDDCVGRR